MSIAQINRKFDREERQLKDKFTIIISEKLKNHIDYLHHKVGPIEWSGVLVCSIIEGNIHTPSKLKILAEDLLLMDIGTSGYTEYEFSADDTYLMEGMNKAFEANKKMAHIHTHL